MAMKPPPPANFHQGSKSKGHIHGSRQQRKFKVQSGNPDEDGYCEVYLPVSELEHVLRQIGHRCKDEARNDMSKEESNRKHKSRITLTVDENDLLTITLGRRAAAAYFCQRDFPAAPIRQLIYLALVKAEKDSQNMKIELTPEDISSDIRSIFPFCKKVKSKTWKGSVRSELTKKKNKSVQESDEGAATTSCANPDNVEKPAITNAYFAGFKTDRTPNASGENSNQLSLRIKNDLARAELRREAVGRPTLVKDKGKELTKNRSSVDFHQGSKSKDHIHGSLQQREFKVQSANPGKDGYYEKYFPVSELKSVLIQIGHPPLDLASCKEKARKDMLKEGKRQSRITLTVDENDLLTITLGSRATAAFFCKYVFPDASIRMIIYFALVKAEKDSQNIKLKLPVKEIYSEIRSIFPFYNWVKSKTWESSVRSELTKNKNKVVEESGEGATTTGCANPDDGEKPAITNAYFAGFKTDGTSNASSKNSNPLSFRIKNDAARANLHREALRTLVKDNGKELTKNLSLDKNFEIFRDLLEEAGILRSPRN